jgi:hypothetical protein
MHPVQLAGAVSQHTLSTQLPLMQSEPLAHIWPLPRGPQLPLPSQVVDLHCAVVPGVHEV